MKELIISPVTPRNISKEFLEGFKQIEKHSMKLGREPTKNELRFIINNSWIEVGIIHSNHNASWEILGGTRDGMFLPDGDILAHSHVVPEDDLVLFDLPSFRDCFTFFAMNPRIKNFVIHLNGIAYFTGIAKHPATGREWHPQNTKELRCAGVNLDELDERGIGQAWGCRKASLEKMGVNIIQKTWRELSDKNPLSQFPFRLPL